MSLLVFILDAAILLAALVTLWIAFGGGGIFRLGAARISVHHIDKLLPLLALLVLPRLLLLHRHALLGARNLQVSHVLEAADHLCTRTRAWLQALDRPAAARLTGLVILLSLAYKLMLVASHPGFQCGDDVEVQCLSLHYVLGFPYDIWTLRNGFYPLVFLFPLQSVLHALGVADPALLVVAGRVVVVLFSGLAIWLAFRLAAVTLGLPGPALLAALLLATAQTHIQFAASELPRPVSSAFILLAALNLPGRSRRGLLLAAAALAVATSIRFSEAVFIPPAVLCLILARRRRDALLLLLVSVVGAALLLGAFDVLVWGKPFSSFAQIIRYTLIEKQSTRGYQSALFYFTQSWRWINVITLAAFLYSLRLRLWRNAVWTLLPILLLSVLPHKEQRYMVPVLPFVIIGATGTLWHVLSRARRAVLVPGTWRSLSAAATLLLCASAVLLEFDTLDINRSDAAVKVARVIAAKGSAAGVMFEQGWMSGAQIYLSNSRWLDLPDWFLREEDVQDALDRLAARPPEWAVIRGDSALRFAVGDRLERWDFLEQPASAYDPTGFWRVYHRRTATPEGDAKTVDAGRASRQRSRNRLPAVIDLNSTSVASHRVEMVPFPPELTSEGRSAAGAPPAGSPAAPDRLQS